MLELSFFNFGPVKLTRIIKNSHRPFEFFSSCMSFRFSSAQLYFAICDRIISCEWWYSCDRRNLHFNSIAGRCNIKSCVMTAVKRQLGDGRPRRRALPDYLSRSATRPACQLTVVSIDFPWTSSSCLTSFSKFIVWPQSN